MELLSRCVSPVAADISKYSHRADQLIYRSENERSEFCTEIRQETLLFCVCSFETY